MTRNASTVSDTITDEFHNPTDHRWRDAERQELSRLMHLMDTDDRTSEPDPCSVIDLHSSPDHLPLSFVYSTRSNGSPRARAVYQARALYTVSRSARRIQHASNNPRKTTRSRALVDRGANGGIAGPEMRLICWTDRYVDLSGIDDHTLEAVHVGSFAAIVKTHLGNRIGIWHQMASMPTGKTIFSSVQLEASRCSVQEKSPLVTGTTPTIITPDGYIVPLSIHQGLPYLRLRPPTDAEWSSLPKITFTTDNEWDPKCLDSNVPDDWYERTDDFSAYLRDSQFLEDGTMKESVIHDEQPNELPEPSDIESHYVDRSMIKSYLHQQIRDELDDVFVYNFVDNHTFEHRLTGSERREVLEILKRPRRSTAKYSPSPSQSPSRSGGRTSRKSKSPSKRNE